MSTSGSIISLQPGLHGARTKRRHWTGELGHYQKAEWFQKAPGRSGNGCGSTTQICCGTAAFLSKRSLVLSVQREEMLEQTLLSSMLWPHQQHQELTGLGALCPTPPQLPPHVRAPLIHMPSCQENTPVPQCSCGESRVKMLHCSP